MVKNKSSFLAIFGENFGYSFKSWDIFSLCSVNWNSYHLVLFHIKFEKFRVRNLRFLHHLLLSILTNKQSSSQSYKENSSPTLKKWLLLPRNYRIFPLFLFIILLLLFLILLFECLLRFFWIKWRLLFILFFKFILSLKNSIFLSKSIWF